MSNLAQSAALQEILAPYPVITRVPVQWAEMDALQHVNNVRYLQWVEAGRVDYFDQLGWTDIAQNPHGVGPILASTDCKYILPLTYPDVVLIGTRCLKLEADRFTLETGIVSERHERLAALNQAVIVTLDYQERRKAKMPDSLREAILAVEQPPI